MKKGLLNGTIILSISVLLSKIIGVFYRIPLINLIGAEGIGLYQQVFSVFAFLLMIVTSATPMAVSRLVSEKIASEGESEGYIVFRRILEKMLLWGIIATFILTFLSGAIAKLQGNLDLNIGYLAIAPSLLLVAVISAYRGYFQGKLNMIPTAISQLVEQIIKLAAGLLLAYYFAPKGVAYAVGGALFGVTLSELVAFLYLSIKALREKNLPVYRRSEGKKLDKGFYAILIPMTIANIIIPLTQLLDSFLVVGFLNLRGEVAGATAQYGILTGAVATVVNLPVAICLTIAVTVAPFLATLHSKREAERIKDKTRTSMKISNTIGVFSSFSLFVCAEGVVNLLYPSLSQIDFVIAVALLKICALGIIFITELQILSNVLQATGDTADPIFVLLIVAIIKIFLTVLLTYFMGIYGAAFATLLAYFVGVFITKHILNEYLGKDFQRDRGRALVLLSGLIMFAITFAVSKFIENNLLVLVVCGMLGTVIFFTLIYLFKIFTKDEMMYIPIIGRLMAKGKKSKIDKTPKD